MTPDQLFVVALQVFYQFFIKAGIILLAWRVIAAEKRGNARGAKGPYCDVVPRSKREAGAT
jgi:hypothetical protein